MNEMKRVLALVLCAVMLVGIMPVSAFAAEAETTAPSEALEVQATEAAAAVATTEAAEIETTAATEAAVLTASEDAYSAQVDGFVDAAIFCSDVHGSTSDLTSVLGGVATSNVDYSAIGFDGDTCLTVDNTTSIVQSALSDTDIAVVFSYASSHDTENSADIKTKWDYSGEAFDNGNYIIYTIREDDMKNDTGADDDFTTWYSGLSAAKKAQPIFILSHRPLHDRRDDNAGAAGWYAAISAAAESSDIVFFWAHNHTSENDVDTAAYYVAKDGTEKFTVYQGDSVVPNFTYMNAGYINANNQDPARLGVATTVQITDTALVFQDYNASGEYTGSYAHNVEVAREFASAKSEAYVTAIAITTDPTKTEYYLGETLDTTGMVVTATYSDNTTAEITPTSVTGYDMSTAGTQKVSVNYYDNGITFSDTFEITVTELAEDAVLTGITVNADAAKTEYWEGDKLLLDGLVVTAAFSTGDTVDLQYKEFSTSELYGGYELDNFNMNDGLTTGKTQTVTVTYTYGEVTCTASYVINVWTPVVSDSTSGISVAVTEDYGVASVAVKESENTNVAAAIAAVIDGDNYVAWDISLTFDEGYTVTTADKTVTLPIPEGVENPVVYYVSDDGLTVTDMKAEDNGDGTVSFVTDHFSIYAVGEAGEEAEKDLTLGTTTTTTKTVYVLTSSISSGNSYLIVNGNAAGSYYALANNGSSVAATGVTVKTDSTIGTYIELDDATEELWTVANGYTFTNQNRYLYRASNSGTVPRIDSSSTNWSYSTTNRRLSYSRNGDTYYLRYNNGWQVTTSSNSASSIYFYVPTEVEVTVDTSTTYTVSASDITHIYDTDSTTADTAALTYKLLANGAEATGKTLSWSVAVVSDPDGILNTTDSTNETLVFTGKTGEAKVRVYCEWTEDGATQKAWTTITVKATEPYYTINLYEKVPNTDAEGGTELVEITAPIPAKGVVEGDTLSVWAIVKEYDGKITYDDEVAAGEDGHDMGTLTDALSWSVSNTSIAKIDEKTGVITFTGKNYGTFDVTVTYTGDDGKLISDTITISATESEYVVPGDGTDDFPEYPNQGAVRFDKTATAVGNFSETGIAMVELSMTGVPYGTSAKTDVVVMVDMTASMSDDDVTAAQLAVKELIKSVVYDETNDVYDSNIQLFVDTFSSGSSDSAVTITNFLNGTTISNATELTAAQNAITFSQSSQGGGTRYNIALADVWETLNRDGHADNQFVVFVSDGVCTAYSPLTDGEKGTTITGDNSETKSLAAGWFDDTGEVTEDFETEYYTYKIKSAGIPVYTVGANLTALSDAADVLNHMSSNYSPDGKTSTGETKYSFFCTTSGGITDEVLKIFQGIGQDIKEAATNVVVEDEIGSAYSVNFSIPGYGTNYAVSEDALDGTTEFYIQVVGYELDEETHERKGEPDVLENFTFNKDGSLKSHTINGIACTVCLDDDDETVDCVTFNSDGTVASIDGTYFDYESNDEGEFLTWTAEKLDTTELALQYFAYLDNSTGVPASQSVPADTYYTNESATLTYDNYLGNRVQQEFPVPQMTWNGAQVSYVFYLVNDAGQPVNKAGRVIPFAEAVYVTDVYTYSVLWNDLEQAAGLEAKYLAQEKVPEIYALYDDDAYYSVHVYEDENKVNLNNHFVIDGDVTDAESVDVGRTNAETTYVFNNKSDAKKYNKVGTYVANDGNDSVDTTTYLCKGEGTVTATIAEVTVTEDTFANSAYYVLNANGKYVRAALYSENTTYYTITSASYTAAEGETHWTPGTDDSTTGAVILDNHLYYIDENNEVYTIVQKSNGTEVRTGFDFSNTTVAFAVVWKPELVEDTVIVDYGLDVLVDVSENDVMAAGVTGVRTDAPNVAINKGTYTNENKKTSVDVVMNGVTVGTAKVENLKQVRFSMNKANSGGMQFTDPAVIYYEADCNYYTENNGTQTLNKASMYSSLTVIPATTVYYEDEYVTLKTFTKQDDGTYAEKTGWDTNSTAAGYTQDVDRPGVTKNMDDIEDWDANNVYGYDGAYSNCATYSMDNAAKINVTSGKYGTATFDFYGTGFDIISSTTSTTGSITVDIIGENAKEYLFVDTYYGYTCQMANVTYVYTNNGWEYKSHVTSETAAEGSYADLNAFEVAYKAANNTETIKMGTEATVHEPYWTKATASEGALYQVPVIKASGLPYGKYSVTIQVSYSKYFDNTDAGNYDFYLDAIRVYDPTGVVSGATENKTVSNAYKADGEGWAKYSELRDIILAADTFGDEFEPAVGAIFIDQVSKKYDIVDYKNYGPNNELYLEKGQMVAFILDPSMQYSSYKLADVQIGLKSADKALGEVQATLTTYTKYTEARKDENGKDVVDENGEVVLDTKYRSNSSTAPIEPIAAGTTATDRYYSIGTHVNPTGATILSIQNTSSTSGILSITNIKLTFTAEPVEKTDGTGTFAMTRSVADGILLAMNAAEDVVEEPEEVLDAELNVSLNKKSVKVGGTVQVKVTTSSDVDALSVNGQEITKFKQNNKTGKRTWTVKVTAEEAGDLDIEVIAYSADGKALDSVVETVEVTAKKSGNVNKTVGQLLGKLFG